MNGRSVALNAGVMVLGVSLLSGCVVAPPPDTEPDSDVRIVGQVTASGGQTQVTIGFSESDRLTIHDYYYREQPQALPPGLAKHDELPPGLQRQVRRNGQLPPGIDGRPLPDELERRLIPLPAGYVRLLVGRDIVLLNQRTRVTVDVIKNIFP